MSDPDDTRPFEPEEDDDLDDELTDDVIPDPDDPDANGFDDDADELPIGLPRAEPADSPMSLDDPPAPRDPADEP
jgi:hypothetical protein